MAELICPVLVTVGQLLSGGVPGIAEIDWEGDVFLLGTRIWDCRPEGDPFVGTQTTVVWA